MNESNQRSSTSSDICELWNGVGIVRVVGTPSIVELIYRIPEKVHGSDTSGSAEIHTLATAKQSGLFVLRSSRRKDLSPEKNSKTNTESSLSTLESNSSHLAAPPNIFFNVSGGSANHWELVLVSVIGVLLQSGVLVYDGVITYHSRARFEPGFHAYAFPFTLFGTLGVMLGTFICAYVVETSTDEEIWEAVGPKKESLQTVWLQRGQFVGDQVFRSFAIYDVLKQHVIRTSRKSPDLKRLEVWAFLGSTLAVISGSIQHRFSNSVSDIDIDPGFVFQFIG
jgi:hypothetical protein